MKTSKNSAGTAFIVMAVPFLALGITQKAILALGLSFLAIGISLMARSRKCGLK